MDALLGITGHEFTIIASSKVAARGISIQKGDEDKTWQPNKHVVMAVVGESGDNVQFPELIQANSKLYSMRHDTDLSPNALAHFTREALASSLRSRSGPYQVQLLLGGVDVVNNNKSCLYWMDYLGTLASVPYAAHGYAQYYCLSILDKHHKPDITLEEGLKLLRLCTDELSRRFLVDYKGFTVKVITKDGAEEIDYEVTPNVVIP